MKYGVFIGRFQPVHNGHAEIINYAIKKYDKVLIIIGSSNAPFSLRNPFSDDMRIKMIQSGSNFKQVKEKIIMAVVEDSNYNFAQWVKDVQKTVDFYLDPLVHDYDESPVHLIGNYKDSGSYWLNHFPKWKLDSVPNINCLSGTEIREAFFKDRNIISVPTGVVSLMLEWKEKHIGQWEKLRDELEYIEKYKVRWEAAPFPPTFVTVDSIVICKGNILVIERGRNPGKGQIALPGGFVGQHEFLKDAAIRELKEETDIDVAKPVLENSLKNVIVYDNPWRDERGRTITHAHIFELNLKDLPKVKAGDDASRASWASFGDIDNLRKKFYSDHYQIIKNVLYKM